jgi:hypothetical protein
MIRYCALVSSLAVAGGMLLIGACGDAQAPWGDVGFGDDAAGDARVVPPVDGAPLDSGVVSPDTSTTAPDTGTAVSDSGGPMPDGSMPDGSAPVDSGSAMDTGVATDTGVTGGDGGCPVGAAAQIEPPGFWDSSNVPPAHNVMMFKFLNRTNGKFPDAQLYWSFNGETHSFADAPTYDMPANSSGRLYLYICAPNDPMNDCSADPTTSKYFDFLEHTIGPSQYNGNTTRVDQFGLKVAMRLHTTGGTEATVGEDYGTFCEDRAATFQRFIDEVPAEFQPLAQPPFAPFRIVRPESGGFGAGDTYADYYDSVVNQIWTSNGITIAKPPPLGNLDLSGYPDLSAAIFRHVGDMGGAFGADGNTTNASLLNNPAAYYQSAPANYYARFWHAHGINGKAYGFPYDDSMGQSSYISYANPQYMLVALGW